jgi:glycosyltransferase involved in cell wall biosynthesis
VSLAIMGEGPHEERLRQRIGELGLADRVTMRGWGTPSDVAAFLRSLDVMILLTRTTRSVREQFGRVIVEAQACGVPVIGSQSGAIPDVVGDGGWIVPERDPAALARLLDIVAADPKALAAQGLAAQSNVSDRFTYRVVADDLVSACETAVRRKA